MLHHAMDARNCSLPQDLPQIYSSSSTPPPTTHLNETKLTDLLNRMNTTSTSIKLKVERSTSRVPFLDLNIGKGSRFDKTYMLDYDLFVKKNQLYMYTDPSSYHPSEQLYSWLSGESIRILRNNTSEENFQAGLLKFRDLLKKRNYPESEITRRTDISYGQRKIFLKRTLKTDKKKLFFTSIKNKAGRHQVVQGLKTAWNFMKRYLPEENTLVPIIRKGNSLFHQTRATNKVVKRNQLLSKLNTANNLISSCELTVADQSTVTTSIPNYPLDAGPSPSKGKEKMPPVKRARPRL